MRGPPCVYSRINHFANFIPLAIATHKLNDITYMFRRHCRCSVRHVLWKQKRKRKNEKRTHMHFSFPFLLCPFPKNLLCTIWPYYTCRRNIVRARPKSIWIVWNKKDQTHTRWLWCDDYREKHHRSSTLRTNQEFVYYEKIAIYDVATTNILNSILWPSSARYGQAKRKMRNCSSIFHKNRIQFSFSHVACTVFLTSKWARDDVYRSLSIILQI